MSNVTENVTEDVTENTTENVTEIEEKEPSSEEPIKKPFISISKKRLIAALVATAMLAVILIIQRNDLFVVAADAETGAGASVNWLRILEYFALWCVPAAAFVLELKPFVSKLGKWQWLALPLNCLAMLYIVELLNKNSFWSKSFVVGLINFAIYLAFYLLLTFGTGRMSVAIVMGNTLLYAVAIINYFKILYRNSSFFLWDIFSAQTAASIVSNYHFNIDIKVMCAISGGVVLLALAWHARRRIRLRRVRLVGMLLAIAAFIVFGKAVVSYNILSSLHTSKANWTTECSTSNGLVLSLFVNLDTMVVTQPDGYDTTQIEAMLSTYADSQETSANDGNAAGSSGGTSGTGGDDGLLITGTDSGDHPNIIVIMNESFADMSNIGELATDEEYTPFINILKNSENAISGKLLVSTYGGGTSLTEYEFLTSNTMHFLPGTSTPYLQYLNSSTSSLCKVLKASGYSTTAIHPFYPTGWNRINAYNYLGFDQFLSIDDFENPETIRGYISDKEDYKKVLDVLKSDDSDDPQFIFTVTMQNHGGYADYCSEIDRVSLTEIDDHPEVETYLSLLKESDSALKYLINELKDYDEDTIVLFFGDHLAWFDSDFYSQLFGKSVNSLNWEEQIKYSETEFVIWANYDIDGTQIDVTSANFLAPLLLSQTNVEMSPYQEYLLELQKTIPAININFVKDSNGDIHTDEYMPEEYESILNQYAILQYNNIFGGKNKITDFFDLGSSD